MELTVPTEACTVEVIGGGGASGAPALLVEVPHGADTAAHYNAVRARMQGDLPPRLERFFHVNTDVGAWDLGRRLAARYVARVPSATAVCVRCAIPRTLIDVNRVLAAPAAGMTPGLPPYVRHPDDQALLVGLHQTYTTFVEALFAQVCGAGGLAVIPHTYAPRTVPITTIDDTIVERLEAAWDPAVVEDSPLRPPFDLITSTPDGRDLSPPGVRARLTDALAAIDVPLACDLTYNLHPSTMGARWAERYPGRVLTFEVRRDLLTVWRPFEPKALRMDRIEALAEAIAGCL